MLIRLAFGEPEIEIRDGRAWWRRYTKGLLHSTRGRPAQKAIDHTRAWYHYGIVHRNGGRPAKVSGRGKHLRALTNHKWCEVGGERWTYCRTCCTDDRARDPPPCTCASVIQDKNDFAWREWYCMGKLHRAGDLPTRELVDVHGYSRE